jgi:hypothetical protein
MAGSSARSQLSRMSDASSTRRDACPGSGSARSDSAYEGSAMKNQLSGMTAGTRLNHLMPSSDVYPYSPKGMPRLVPSSSDVRLMPYSTANAASHFRPACIARNRNSTAPAISTCDTAKKRKAMPYSPATCGTRTRSWGCRPNEA